MGLCVDESVGPQIARFIGPTWGPPGSFRPQMGPMLAPTLLSRAITDANQTIFAEGRIYISPNWTAIYHGFSPFAIAQHYAILFVSERAKRCFKSIGQEWLINDERKNKL